jgi:hypothetical protein
LYEITNLSYEIKSNITFMNVRELTLIRQKIEDLSLFEKKYFPFLKILNMQYNNIKVLENFDINLELDLFGNPIELIKESFNIKAIKYPGNLYYICEKVNIFFENIKTYIDWLTHAYIYYDYIEHQTEPQLDYNVYSYIKPSLVELACNKMQKKKFQKRHKSDYEECMKMLPYLNDSLGEKDHCDICDKINILYPRFLGGKALMYKENVYVNHFNKVIIGNLCYECYNKENIENEENKSNKQ